MKQSDLKIKDFLVSGEVFSLKPSGKYKELFHTSPTPPLENLGKYYQSDDYISHQDDSKGLLNKIYYQVKKFNHLTKKKWITNAVGENKKVLDYGCGTGEFVSYLNDNNFDAYGIEPNSNAINLALNKNPNKIFSDSTILENEKFDVITLFHVLEHIPNLENEISKIKKALKPDGILLIAVPNYKSFDANYYKEFWAAYDTPRHLWHFTENSIQDIFARFGMIIENTHPLWFDSFYISLISEKYKNNSLGIFIAPLIGLISNLKAIKTGEFSSKVYQLVNEKPI